MFVLLEGRREIAEAQHLLESTVRRELRHAQVRKIGYQGGSIEAATIATDGTYWFWSRDRKGSGAKTPRRLNWFGLLREAASLSITVEVNVGYEGSSKKMAGFFARDVESGTTYLLHSGRLGGSTKGVGKFAFLTWMNQLPVEVTDSSGEIREGLIVMPLTGRASTVSAARYTDRVAEFKLAARNKVLTNPAFEHRCAQLKAYYSESRGRRRGTRPTAFDYVSRHGDIVDALELWRKSQALPEGASIVKSVYLDLGLAIGDEVIEVFEAKSSGDRQAIYGAIGQLLVHGTSPGCRRTLVLPVGETLYADLKKALDRLHIQVLRCSLDDSKATILP